mmetsp:Transcript_36904/g.42939  ORF Transcript_36904/g.42939 Transcript_36904/m.42939 type:complete len:484 (+) Transcript_36904:196-1647(+)|eukprot:CAMPEP_0194354734 /NCGR_PEP_ID=MMETSP0174-20130528/2790_1 /TAXON_ID=216777 /ORGANISM="Proboscia alata, Strain PI-D3" /LENGTH=483 /DNA_ID=CAMNT_0039123747 /DNA_START=166 /DNA_END=1617 /DNA_ORIENTATION=-
MQGGDNDALSGNETATMNAVIEVCSNILLFLLIFGMSCTVEPSTLRQQLRNKYALSTGLAMQFIVMPLLGFVCVYTLKDYISPSQGMMVLIITSSPGGSFSNWWCSLFNAELALSVAMTAISTLMSILLLPCNLLLYTHLAYGGDEENNVLRNVKWVKLFVSLIVVILGILVGLFCSAQVRSKRFQLWSNRLGTFSGLSLIIFSALISSSSPSSTTEETKLWNQKWSFYVVTLTPCVMGLLLTTILSSFLNLKRTERVTLSVECCYQNVGIATTAAVGMFMHSPQHRAEALCVPLFYGVVEAVILGIYCIVCWKIGWTKAPPTEKFFVMLSKTYEVSEDTQNADSLEKKMNSKNNDISVLIDIDTTVPDNPFNSEAIYDSAKIKDDKLIKSGLQFSSLRPSNAVMSFTDINYELSEYIDYDNNDLPLPRSRTITEETHATSVSSSSSESTCSAIENSNNNHNLLNSDSSSDLSKISIDEMVEL